MTDRLTAICALIVPANTIADVGCDHAMVAEYVVDRGLAQNVIASDISEECLKKARERMGEGKARFICCDGLRFDCDEAIIAGIGGINIVNILENASSLPKTLVLCPHRDEAAVRRALTVLGYGIDVDRRVLDRKKIYPVIRARIGGGTRELNELQMLFGRDIATPDPLTKRHLLSLRAAYMRAPGHNAQILSLIAEALALQGVTDQP